MHNKYIHFRLKLIKPPPNMTKRNIIDDTDHAYSMAKRRCARLEVKSEDNDLIFVFAEEDSKVIRSFTKQQLRQALEEPRRRRMLLIENLAREEARRELIDTDKADWNWLHNDWYDYFEEWPLSDKLMREAIFNWREWFEFIALGCQIMSSNSHFQIDFER